MDFPGLYFHTATLQVVAGVWSHAMLFVPFPSSAIHALPSCRWWLASGCSCSAWERLHGRLAIGWESHKRSAFDQGYFAYSSCALPSALLTCSSDAFPSLLCRLKTMALSCSPVQAQALDRQQREEDREHQLGQWRGNVQPARQVSCQQS